MWKQSVLRVSVSSPDHNLIMEKDVIPAGNTDPEHRLFHILRGESRSLPQGRTERPRAALTRGHSPHLACDTLRRPDCLPQPPCSRRHSSHATATLPTPPLTDAAGARGTF
ncbi:hypothetical protein FKM82_021345 [Ascaphus truei]